MRVILPATFVALLVAGCLGPANSSSAGDTGGAVKPNCPAPCLAVGPVIGGGLLPLEEGDTGSGFSTYSTGGNGAEPTIGVTNSGTTIYIQAGLGTWRSTSSGSSWAAIGPITTALATLDPMMYYDPAIDNLYVDQLYVACTELAFHENPSAATGGFDTNWRTNPAACGIPGIDHQKLEGGPSPLLGLATGGRSLYMGYSQAGSGAIVAKSIDHGLTWTSHSAIPSISRGSYLWPTGPVTADPAGTWVYLPAHGPAGLKVGASANEGLTYSVSTVSTGAGATHSVDPEIAVDAGGNVYVIWYSDSGHQVKYAYSTNHGATWSSTVTVSSPTGTPSTVFPTAVARSTGKLDIAYYGTPTSSAGPDACPNSGSGACKWYLYMAQVTAANTASPTISITQVTPNSDPIQIGVICTDGAACASGTRNLLDFIDIEVDGSGWAHVAYTDGCTGTCGSSTTSQSLAAASKYARQTAGSAI